MTGHQEYQELLALHALDALDASERPALEAHLAQCAECRSALSEWRDATGLLAHAAMPTAPSDGIRARILTAARMEARSQSRGAATNIVPMLPRKSNLWPNLLRIAAGVAIVGLLIGVIVFWRRDVGLQREIVQINREKKHAENLLASEREARAKASEALAMLNSRETKKMELAGTQTAQNARATFVFDPKTGHAMLLTEGLPKAPADKAYEFWFIPKGHTPMPGKTFTVDAKGTAIVTQQIPQEALEHAVFAITLEPKNGVAVPTGAIYLSSPSS